jgi:hypothetical protein
MCVDGVIGWQVYVEEKIEYAPRRHGANIAYGHAVSSILFGEISWWAWNVQRKSSTLAQ